VFVTEAPPVSSGRSPAPDTGVNDPVQKMSVVVVEDPGCLPEHVPAWEDLAAMAIEPNPFYEPWVLLPAVRMFGAGQRLLFAFVYTPDPKRPAGAPLLCGLFPLRRTRHPRLRVSLLQLWSHDYCFLCTPLLRAGYAREALAAFADWLAGDPRSSLVEYGAIAGEGPFHRVLVDHLRERGSLACVTSCHTRAFFRRRSDAENYLQAALSGNQRRDLKRREKRLADGGPLDYQEFGPADDVESWAESFMRLEAAGWKGREKTALACDAAGREFFLTVAREGARRGQLMMHSLNIAGRPVAMKCSFVTGEGSFFFKPAYDEEYARHAPGVLLELETIRRLHAHSQVRWMDSCTTPDNHMLNRMWIDRRVIQTVVVATDKRFGGLAVSLIPLLRWLKKNFS
jgi:CelD/BcsL family acetyltransferase involved in cellulose biosynthesis